MQDQNKQSAKVFAHCALLASSMALLASAGTEATSRLSQFLSSASQVEIQSYEAASGEKVSASVDLSVFLKEHSSAKQNATAITKPPETAIAAIGFVESLLDQARAGSIRMNNKDQEIIVSSLSGSLGAIGIKDQAQARVVAKRSRNADNDRWLTSAVSYALGGQDGFYKPKAPASTRALIERVAKTHGLPALVLLSLVEQESFYNPNLVSRAGAVGLSQVLPSTALWMETGKSRFTEEQLSAMQTRLKNPEYNLQVGAKYLKGLVDQFGGDLDLALASYNAGPNAVERAGGVPNYPETLKYVDTIKVRILIKAFDRIETALSNEPAATERDNQGEKLASAARMR